MTLRVLYRGPLSSCNYGCAYCPFAKAKSSREELAEDRANLTRFVDWAQAQHDLRLGVFFTPWGEALIRSWYRDALVRLSHLPNIERAVIQTNLSGPLDFVTEADRGRLALWCTYHPEWTTEAEFLDRCEVLMANDVRFSVGVVGFASALPALRRLRAALPHSVYVWVNAVKRELHNLPAEVRAEFGRIDPHFERNTVAYPSEGAACAAGLRAISVRGDGSMRRCHFVQEEIGNIYAPGWREALRPRPCTAATCRCHIGYVHMDKLGLYDTFAGGILERIPAGWA